MKRTMAGVISGLAIWLGSALAAEAQQITPTGPMAITTGSISSTYTASITLPSLQDYAVQVFVYRNGSQSAFWSSETWFYSPTTLTANFSQCVSWVAPAVTGEKFTFKANLVLTDPVQVIPATNWVKFVTRSTSTTYVESSKPLELAFEVIDRDRRHEA
jgi:hypothetical protein